MKIQHQALSAVSTTAILLAVGMGMVMLDGSGTSFAEPIDPAAVSALQAAVSKPTDSLKSLIDQMNAQQPGSGTQFVQAFKNGDTDALATALANVAAGNAALQNTIASALSTLASEPALAAVPSSSGAVNVASVVTSVTTMVQTHFQAPPQSAQTGQTPQNVANNQQTPANGLPNLNPGAPAPFVTAGPPGGLIGNPFTRGNPAANPGLNPSPSVSVGPTNTPPGPPPTGPGQPNSRA